MLKCGFLSARRPGVKVWNELADKLADRLLNKLADKLLNELADEVAVEHPASVRWWCSLFDLHSCWTVPYTRAQRSPVYYVNIHAFHSLNCRDDSELF